MLPAAAAEPLRNALSADAVDWEHCAAFADGKILSAPLRDTLAIWLGLAKPASGALPMWSTGRAAGETRHFRVVCKEPITVGTVCSSAEFVAVMRDDMALPGDLQDDRVWQLLPAGNVRPLDLGAKTRALRVTLKRHNLPWENPRKASEFPSLRLLSGHCFNPAEFGYRGWSRPAAQKGSPAELQWLRYWPEPLRIAGLFADRPVIANVTLAALEAKEETHPRLAQDADWQAVSAATSLATTTPTAPLATRAIRLRIPAGNQPTPPMVSVLVSLADDTPTPCAKSYSFQPTAPVELKYDMPLVHRQSRIFGLA